MFFTRQQPIFGNLQTKHMKTKTNEQALEATIEKQLTGTCLEELASLEGGVEDPSAYQRAGNGYWIGHAHDFDIEFAIDKARFWDFLERTQPDELDKLAVSNQTVTQYWVMIIKTRLIAVRL